MRRVLQQSICAVALGPLIACSVMAEETCGRTATVNYQKVLVDTNSSQRGDGLRYYLEKDPAASMYLEKYREGSGLRWQSAILGTLGSAMMLGGVMTSGSGKKTLLIGGAVMVTVNFFIARTTDYTNESYLDRAVEEYNKRNLPKIYLDAEDEAQENSPAFQLEWKKDF